MRGRVVIGVGNEMRGDDSAGLEVVRLLRGVLPEEVPVLENGGEPAGLVEAWTGAGLAVVIDTTVSGTPPGTVRRYTVLGRRPSPGDVPWTAPAAGHGSSHALGIADAIALGHALDRLPGELVLYTVEGADFRLGAPVTPAVRHAIGEIATTVADLVRP
ncbi:hydrogenase maturation protease [Streptosporangium sp. NPDC004631]